MIRFKIKYLFLLIVSIFVFEVKAQNCEKLITTYNISLFDVNSDGNIIATSSENNLYYFNDPEEIGQRINFPKDVEVNGVLKVNFITSEIVLLRVIKRNFEITSLVSFNKGLNWKEESTPFLDILPDGNAWKMDKNNKSFASRDYGKTWNRIKTKIDFSKICGYQLQPNQTLYAIEKSGQLIRANIQDNKYELIGNVNLSDTGTFKPWETLAIMNNKAFILQSNILIEMDFFSNKSRIINCSVENLLKDFDQLYFKMLGGSLYEYNDGVWDLITRDNTIASAFASCNKKIYKLENGLYSDIGIDESVGLIIPECENIYDFIPISENSKYFFGNNAIYQEGENNRGYLILFFDTAIKYCENLDQEKYIVYCAGNQIYNCDLKKKSKELVLNKSLIFRPIISKEIKEIKIYARIPGVFGEIRKKYSVIDGKIDLDLSGQISNQFLFQFDSIDSKVINSYSSIDKWNNENPNCLLCDLNSTKRTKRSTINSLGEMDNYIFLLSLIKSDELLNILSFQIENLKYIEPLVIHVTINFEDSRQVHIWKQLINENDFLFPLQISDGSEFYESYSLELWQVLSELIANETIENLSSLGNASNRVLEYLILNKFN